MTHSIESLLLNRRSVRGYQTKLIDTAVIQSLLSTAHKTQSHCNSQPWHCYVATGDAVARLKKAFVDTVVSGTPDQSEIDLPKYENEYQERRVECAKTLYDSMNITKDDKPARQMAMLRNFEFFDAPHVMFLASPKSLGTTGMMDTAMFASNLTLLMQANNIGSCMQGSLRHYPHIIRDIFSMPDDQALVMGISFGYIDDTHLTCAANPPRVDITSQTTFIN